MPPAPSEPGSSICGPSLPRAPTALPRLRDDLELLHEDGRALLVDPVVGAVHSMTDAEGRALAVLDGKSGTEAVGERAGLSLRKTKALVRRLREGQLLETPATRKKLDEHQAEHERRNVESADKAVRLRRLPISDPHTRWDCHACGMCCRGLTVPLRTDEIERIDASLYGDLLGCRSFHVPHAAGGGAAVERVLRQVGRDDRCIFLLTNGRCAVHARQGASSKPDVCQLFPLASVATPAGPRLTLRIACGSLHRSHLDGQGLDRYAEPCFTLEKRDPVRGLYDAPLAGRRVGFDVYAEIERKLTAELDRLGACPAFVDAALTIVPEASLPQHEADRRRLGEAIAERLRLDRIAPAPLIGWFASKLARSGSMRRALGALGSGLKAPEPAAATSCFIARTFRQVLFAGEPYKLPDLQVGLRGLLLFLELILHTVGSRGTPTDASRATRIWWMAGFEDGELTPILWEALWSHPDQVPE